MGYNISDVGGQTGGGADIWTATLDLSDPTASTISGDFDVVPLFVGTPGEATDGYTFSALSNPSFGTLTFNTTDGTYTFTVNRAAVIASGSDQVVSFTVTGQSGGSSDTDTVQITILICFCRGTLIDTPGGKVPVENLSTGDRVLTLDNEPQSIRWIGSQKFSRAQMSADHSLRPIRIRRGALGKNRPDQDLLVSPNHRILLEDWRAELMFGMAEVLVPAKSLVNDSTILRETEREQVEYFHILLDDHNVVFSNGAPTESLHPGTFLSENLSNRSRSDLTALLPQLKDLHDYGAIARHGLKSWEGQLLCLTEPGGPT